MPENKDIRRLRAEYNDRARRFYGKDTYSLLNQINLFIIQSRQRAANRLLEEQFPDGLTRAHLLEIGCGSGQVLTELLLLGTKSRNLHGVDLLTTRIREAEAVLPDGHFLLADGQNLPFKSGRFDLVLQFTAFSSVLDPAIKKNMASEMLRVLKPDGMILWYDFWLNPTNKQTKGIRKPEIRSLFPGCAFEFRKITLAPPIARRLVPVSWILCMILEKLKVFNTHYLVAIRKNVS